MESRFGHDFSRVRVHTGARAAESAQAVNALAYTVGRDVVFATGQYAPTMDSGRRLLAHELAHAIQQEATSAPGNSSWADAGIKMSSSRNPFETQANDIADWIGGGIARSPVSAGYQEPRDIARGLSQPFLLMQRKSQGSESLRSSTLNDVAEDAADPADKDSSNEDILITIAWPDKEVNLTPQTKWVGYIGFMGADAKAGTIKAGHAGVIIIERKTGQADYYDYGRYNASPNKGRVRDAGSDPGLKLKYKAKFDEKGNIENLDAILKDIASKKEFHGDGDYGKMIASVTKNVNYEKAKRFAESMQEKGETPYGPFQLGGSNCARFVADLIIESDAPLAVKADVWLNATPSPGGNVENADTEEQIYTVEKGKLTSEKTGALECMSFLLPDQASSALAEVTKNVKFKVVTSKGGLALRSSAKQEKGNVLVWLPQNSIVTSTGQSNNGFLEVTYKGQKGWVNKDFLRVNP